MSTKFSLVVLAAGLAGCTSTTAIHVPLGKPLEFSIGCGMISDCYSRANDLCPDGVDVLNENHNFNQKAIRVRCDEPVMPAASQ